MASYLDRLQFDPRLRDSFHGKYLTNFRLVFLLIVSIIVIGIINFLDIPRRLNPEVQIPIVTITTVLPGATPDDVEALLTIPIEDQLQSIENVDVMTSTSRNNVSLIVLQFLSTVDPDEARDEVQQAVDTVQDMPEDATDPAVNILDFENQPVWTFALTSDDLPSLMAVADNLQDELTDLSQVDRVEVSGLEDQEIQVIIDPTKVQEYGISPLQLSQSIAAAANSFPAGSVRANGSAFSLSIDPAITSIDDIRDIRISSQERIVSLGEIAQVSERSLLDQNKTYLANNELTAQRAVQFFVYKTSGSNINEAAKQAVEAAESFLEPYTGTIHLITVSNTGELIDDQFDDLLSEFQTTILLIFIVLLVFLGLRQAVIASITVPLTFLSAIAIANSIGLTLNFLTMFSFLLALGLLIDDTIVVVTAMTRYYASGKFTPAETGLLVWRDFIIPLWATTATTVWSFLPLLLATGIIGEFIKPIPLIVTATMLSSTSIAVLITIPLLIVFLKLAVPYRVRILIQILGALLFVSLILIALPKNLFLLPILLLMILLGVTVYINNQLYREQTRNAFIASPFFQRIRRIGTNIMDQGIVNLEAVSYRYRSILERILVSTSNRRKLLILLTVFALTSYLLVPLGFVRNEFFPSTDEDTIYLSVILPSGTSIETTTAESLTFLNQTRHIPEVKYIVADTGFAFNANFERTAEPAAFLLTLTLDEDRARTSIELAEDLRTYYRDYTRGDLIVQEISGGPPAGADLTISVLGDDLAVLDQYADKIIAYLEEQPGVANVDKSIKPGTSTIVFEPDATKLAAAGISRETIALWLRTYVSGFTLDTIRFDDDQDVTFRMSTEHVTPAELSTLYIQSPTGSIPLIDLGQFKLATNPTIITHEDTLRTISVSGTVSSDYAITEVNQQLEAFADNLGLPQGYTWKTGGVNEENQESVNSIMQAMGVSFLLILVTMVIEFGSYRQALIVMLTIPLAVSGVFYVFALTGTPLSFPALIGVLALFGIVVTNAIVVVDKINSNIAEGMELKESILDASGSRLEPVLLTSLTTIFGLLPITLSDPLWRGLGGAIIAGLFFSGVIKLFFIPVMFYSWFKK